MTLRNGLRQSKLLTFVVLGAFVWLLVALLDLLRSIDLTAVLSPDYVGQGSAAGLVGALVLAIVLGVLVVLYSELGETSPAPDSWPPRER